ncbi:tetratricopeptide repeat-containing sensor histidine kinase [Ekhidna sp.]|uniref:tetratricopeptide repeat-containing sensor histidine kinase n=1 Tax=Ekhidna sp. TaxID=2608089 RepID=UPI003CCBB9B2
MHHAQKSYQYAKLSERPKSIGLGLTSIGWAFDYNYQFDSAIHYYTKSYNYALQHEDTKRVATSLFNVGVVFYYQGQLDSALYYYLASKPKFEALNDEPNLSRLYNNLGRIYEKTNQLEHALEVSRNSIVIKERLGDTRGLLNTYTNMSSIFQRQDNYDSALVYSEKCIKKAKEVGDLVAYKSELVNLGIIYKNQENKEKAINAFKEAESLILEDEDPYVLSQIFHNLGEFYFEENDFDQAEVYVKKTREVLLEEKYLETALKHYHLDYALNKKNGNSAGALKSLEKYLDLNEKFISQELISRTSELEQLYQKEKRELEIETLNAENQIQNLRIEKNLRDRNGWIIFSLLVIGIALLLYRLYRIKQKSLNERDILLKEIHHRVKNNLQVISSLLNLQADSLESDAAKDAVKEGQQRVKSMALIHQKLYSADDVRGVDVQDYLENLSKELFKAFGVNEEKINWKVNTNGLKLDIDTIIPLGLIINELITNSIKYAFEDDKNGLLEIQMKEEGENLNVVVADNGKGLDEQALAHSNAFGWKMIQSLGRKLKANINVNAENGTRVNLVLSRYKLVA